MSCCVDSQSTTKYCILFPDQVPPTYAEAPIVIKYKDEKCTRMMAVGLAGANVSNAELKTGEKVVDGEIAPMAMWWMSNKSDSRLHVCLPC
jgi:hypothetical protein